MRFKVDRALARIFFLHQKATAAPKGGGYCEMQPAGISTLSAQRR
jgi:hypothetical protein